MYPCYIFIHFCSAAPAFVPVKTHTPCIFGSFRITKNSIGSLKHQVTVMIPHDYFLISKTFSFHCWAQIVFQKISFFFRSVNAGFPTLCGHWFVLYRYAPNGYAFLFVHLYKLCVIISPGLIEGRF